MCDPRGITIDRLNEWLEVRSYGAGTRKIGNQVGWCA
jgi:hypothetical protein